MPRQKKDFLLNPVVITVIVIIALIVAFNFYQNMMKLNQIENRIDKIETEIAKAEAKNKELEQQIENSNSYEYIEEVARKKLGLIKPGEQVFIPVEEDKDKEEVNSDQKNNN